MDLEVSQVQESGRKLVWDKWQIGGIPFDKIVIENNVCRFIFLWVLYLIAALTVLYFYFYKDWRMEIAIAVGGSVTVIFFLFMFMSPIYEAIIADLEKHTLQYVCYGICCCCKNKEAPLNRIEKGYIVYGVLRKTRGCCTKEDYYCHDFIVILKGGIKIDFIKAFYKFEPTTLRTFVRTYINFEDKFTLGESVIKFGSDNMEVCEQVEEYRKDLERRGKLATTMDMMSNGKNSSSTKQTIELK
ncbi:MAG: hypothetical protein MJ252_24805 [archaeon]|nr:hypothetical protein [archaeon]